MTSTIRLNVSTPFLQGVPNSLISKDWYRFLQNIVTILGNGSDVVTLESFETQIYTSRSPIDNSATIRTLNDTVSLLSQARSINQQLIARISALESLLSNQSKTASSANAVAVQDNSSNANTVYPLYAVAVAGNQGIYSSKANYSFFPAYGLLTTSQFAIGDSNGTMAHVKNGMYGTPGTNLLFAVNSLLAATLTSTLLTATQYAITGGSAAGVVDGMFGVPGTSLNWAIGGTQYGHLTNGGFYSSAFNNVTLTQPASGCTFTLANGKTFTVSNTLTLTATDGSTLAIGTGGTLGTAAYTATTAYVPSEAPVASGGAATAAGAAYDQTQANTIVTLVNNIRTALIGNGVMT